MSDYSNSWDTQHTKGYKKAYWIDKPSIFAEDIVPFFPKNGELLDLGAGQGQDSRFFANLGYKVTSTDFSEEALKINEEKSRGLGIKVEKLDLSEKFPYSDESFDTVYAHLSLHYFEKSITEMIFDEIYRVLKTGGLIALLLNSTSDPEYKTGEELEKDFFKIGTITKRYFSPETLAPLVSKFETIVLDNKGETYKDREKGIGDLIRFVGRKID